MGDVASPPSIPMVQLSHGGVSLPILGFGMGPNPRVPDEVSKAAALEATEVGYRHFDTAPIYLTEKGLGQAISEALERGMIKSREDIFVTSKLWCSDAHPRLVVPALKRSLQALNLEYLDLYMIHWPVSGKPMPPKYPLKEEDFLPIDLKGVWTAMEECQRLGLTKAIGVCNFTRKKLEQLLAIATIPPAVNQVEVNPKWQQKELIKFCKTNGILVMAHSPLGGPLEEHKLVMESNVLQEIAKAKGKSVAQMEEERILKIHYRANYVDLTIDDVDKCLLIDVINDMCEEFANRGFELPEYPGLHYCYNQKAIMLVDDGSLMKMFETVENKEIDIWVDCLSEPSFILSLARTVKPQQLQPNEHGLNSTSSIVAVPQTNDEPVPGPSHSKSVPEGPPVGSLVSHKPGPSTFSSKPPRSKLPVKRKSPRISALQNSPPQNSASLHPSIPLSIGSRRLPRLLEEISLYPPHVSLEHSNHSQFSSPSLHQGQSSSPTPLENPSVSPKPARVRCRRVIFPHGKKMPHSTARLKGIQIPSTQESQVEEVVHNTRGRCRSRDPDVCYEEEGTSYGSGSDSEGEYVPTNEEEDEESGDGGDDDVIEENVIDVLNHDFVDGNWEPFEEPERTFEADSYLRKLYKNGEVYDDAVIGKIRLRAWQLFVDREHFKDVLRDYCIQEGFALVVRKAEHDRYTAECADIRCSWRIHASLLNDGCTWAIKSIKEPHVCDLNLVHNIMCNCEWAAKKLLDDIRACPDIKAKAINELLWERFGITMARSTVYKMKGIAMWMIQGGHDDSYSKLNAYCHLLKERNPGTIAFCTWVELQQPEQPLQFRSIFISYAAQFRGVIEGCRGLVGVDGCHLKGNYGGVLLSAVSLDGNNEIFPVAVAVVDSENKQSWCWFFHQLKEILTETGRTDWTIMSDRQKGIDPSLDQVWPKVPRRYCARHLCKNFKSQYPGMLMHKLFWAVTNAYSEFSFRKALIKLQSVAGLGAVKWFRELGPLDRWTRWRFDSQLCSDENTNNFVESFNSTIGVDRNYPILTLLEGVRRIAMVRHATRQQTSEQWVDGVCPNIRERVRVLMKESRFCHAYPAGRGEYEISDGKSMLPVSLNSRTCVCGRWQISGIPCRHGIRALLAAGKEPTDYVSEWYSVARYKAAYAGNIMPIPDAEQWPDLEFPKMVPPPIKRSVGRPSRNRRREEGEQRKGKRSAAVKCQKCQQYGHNTLTCKGGATKKELLAQQAQQGKRAQQAEGKGKMDTRQCSQPSNTNLIELMIHGATSSQPIPMTQPVHIPTSSQPPSTRKRSMPPPRTSSSQPIPRISTGSTARTSSASTQSPPPSELHQIISPKRQKILNRLSML